MRSGMTTALALAALLTACTDDLLSGPGNLGGDFDIGAGSGTQPAYSWSAGPAFTVVVVRTADPTVVVWRIADPDNSDIRSPVTHGVVPGGALETSVRERTLTRGVNYRVTITLADGRSGYREFTP